MTNWKPRWNSKDPHYIFRNAIRGEVFCSDAAFAWARGFFHSHQNKTYPQTKDDIEFHKFVSESGILSTFSSTFPDPIHLDKHARVFGLRTRQMENNPIKIDALNIGSLAMDNSEGTISDTSVSGAIINEPAGKVFVGEKTGNSLPLTNDSRFSSFSSMLIAAIVLYVGFLIFCCIILNKQREALELLINHG